MNKTVKEFSERFEVEFGEFLLPVHQDAEGALYTNFFKIYPAQADYSDWDIECYLKDNIEEGAIKKMEKYIRNYKDFKYVGHLVSSSKKFSNIVHHSDRARALYFMAFMPNVSSGPFIDIHIEKVSNSYIQKSYNEKDEDELISWLMLTAWRKFKNRGLIMDDDLIWFVDNYIVPAFPEYRKEILKDPILFFKKQFSHNSYKDAVQFLST